MTAEMMPGFLDADDDEWLRLTVEGRYACLRLANYRRERDDFKPGIARFTLRVMISTEDFDCRQPAFMLSAKDVKKGFPLAARISRLSISLGLYLSRLRRVRHLLVLKDSGVIIHALFQ